MKATLAVKLALASVCSLILVLAVLLVLIQHFERNIIADHIKETGEATGRQTARQALLGVMTRDLPSLTRLVSQLVAEDGSILDVVIVDRKGQVVAASNQQKVGRPWRLGAAPSEMVVHSPVLDGGNQQWGTVHMTYSLAPMRRVVNKTRQIIIALGLVACALGVVLSIVMAKYLTAPLRRLWLASQKLACGDYQCVLPTVAETDIAQIADGFQALVGTIRNNEAKLRQAERHAAIGAVAAHAAHELKNSLTPIKSFGSALSSPLIGEASPSLSRYLQRASTTIPRAVQRVEHLTLGLLNLAKAPDYEMKIVNASDIASAVRELMLAEAENKFIKLSLTKPEAPVYVQADAEQMEGVLINLVTNALEAIRAGGSINIQLDHDTEMAYMSVQDDGPGISDENVNRIFDPYFSTKSGGANSGLGLALVQKIVVEHGGRVVVASQPRSTKFTIILPRSLPVEESRR